MKIREMTAKFGVLDNETLRLEPGLNIITAPNESGKSTWCAFIRAMLYGVNASERERAGYKPDKLRYAPWSGAPMSGEMELEHGGRRITITRYTKTPSAPMRGFSAVYTGTAEPVPGLTGADAGLYFTGVTREVFERSAFAGQGALGVRHSDELEKRIAAIVTSGEEGASSTQAGECLRAWQRKRKFRKTGKIPELESEAEALRARLERMSGAVREREELMSRLGDARERERRAGQAHRNELENGAVKLLESVGQKREALRIATERAADVRGAIREREAECAAGVFSGKTAGEAEIEAKSARDAFAEAEALPKKVLPAAIAAAVLCAVLAVLAVFSLLPWPAATGFGALLIAIAAASLLSARRKAVARCHGILVHYAVSSPEEIGLLVREHAAALTALDTARRAQFGAEREVQRRERELRQCEAELVRRRDGAARTEREMRDARSETAALERRLSELRGRFDELGDPLVLETELAALETQLAELRGQYDALELAINTLAEADAELSQRFSPELSRRAGEIFAVLTGKRYDRVLFDRALAARVRPGGESTDREAACLSLGAMDQLYLSLRLAVCALALPEGASCPLILDDALVNFDDERAGRAIALLVAIARERQVILFTCHEREQRIFDGLRRRGAV